MLWKRVFAQLRYAILRGMMLRELPIRPADGGSSLSKLGQHRVLPRLRLIACRETVASARLRRIARTWPAL
jgi:hypothetical protein